MEGLEISEILLTNLNTEKRFDSEYFRKAYLIYDKLLSNKVNLCVDDFAEVTDGIHTSIDYSDSSKINLISATSPKGNIFDLTRAVYISENAHRLNPRTALKELDVIISTVGTIGNCAVVDSSILPANSDRHVGIIRMKNNSISPYYLSTFLLSKYGRYQTIRESTGNVQLNLFIYKIRTLVIPVISNHAQLIIENKIKQALDWLANSANLYSHAEQIMLKKLNVEYRQYENLGSIISSIKSFKDSFLSIGRLDAEYYQTKYDKIVALIKSKPYKPLHQLVNIKKSIEPGSNAYETVGIPFVRVSDVSKFELSNPEIHLNPERFNIGELQPKKNTILFSKDGSIGIAHKVEEDLNVITSSALLHLTIKDEAVLPDYLTLVLNSITTQMQAERDAGGSIIQHWRIDEIKNVLIPVLDEDIQKEISEKVQESFKLRKQSKMLLEAAKKAVEIAIEESEEAAIKYLNNIGVGES